MKNIHILAFSAMLFVGCNSTDKKFLITNNNVGILPKCVEISKLDSIYAKDSLVRTASEGEFRYASDERIIIFEKGTQNKQLLEITPSRSNNEEVAYAQSIQILDERFTTEKGISIKSTFADIKKVYKEFDIETSLNSIIISPKEGSLYFVFDKTDLMPTNTGDYTLNDIPDSATIKRLMITWIK